MRRRRYRSISSRSALVWLALLCLAAVRSWQGCHEAPEAPPPTLDEQQYRVQRAVDGDTLLLANRARVRLIGVDAPETVKPHHPIEAWGPEASAFTKQFVAGGIVQLQFDHERLDKYHRYLAYVWVDGRMLNEELVRAGLARVELNYHYAPTMKTRFRRAEAEARAAHRGIWSSHVPTERDKASLPHASPGVATPGL